MRVAVRRPLEPLVDVAGDAPVDDLRQHPAIVVVDVGEAFHVIALRHDEAFVQEPSLVVAARHVVCFHVDDELVTDVVADHGLGAAAEGAAEDVDAGGGEGEGEDEGDERHHGHLGHRGEQRPHHDLGDMDARDERDELEGLDALVGPRGLGRVGRRVGDELAGLRVGGPREVETQGDEGEEGDGEVRHAPAKARRGGAEVAALRVGPHAGDQHLEADLGEHEKLEDDVHEVDHCVEAVGAHRFLDIGPEAVLTHLGEAEAREGAGEEDEHGGGEASRRRVEHEEREVPHLARGPHAAGDARERVQHGHVGVKAEGALGKVRLCEVLLAEHAGLLLTRHLDLLDALPVDHLEDLPELDHARLGVVVLVVLVPLRDLLEAALDVAGHSLGRVLEALADEDEEGLEALDGQLARSLLGRRVPHDGVGRDLPRREQRELEVLLRKARGAARGARPVLILL